MHHLFHHPNRHNSSRRKTYYQPCVVALFLVLTAGLARFGAYQGRTAPAPGDPATNATVARASEGTNPPPATALGTTAGTNSVASSDATPQLVTVGLYLYSIRNLDIRANSYSADFYIWFLWKGDNDPTKSFEFMNSLVSPEKRPIYTDAAGTDTPQVLPDGRKLQQYHVQGSFGHAFDLSRYPVDEQDLTIEIEDAKATAQELAYVIDEPGLGIHDTVNIPAWIKRGLKGVVRIATYRTAFGDPRSKGDNEVSNATFALHISRPVLGTILPNVVPIFFTLLLAWCAFFLGPTELGTRISAFAMAVMSVLFLHLAYGGDVPPGTSSLVDHIHNLSYLLLVIATIAAIKSANIAESPDDAAARRFDRKAFAILVTLFLAGTAAIFAF